MTAAANDLLRNARIQTVAAAQGWLRIRRWKAGIGIAVTAAVLAGCAGVQVTSVAPADYMASRRGDILTNGRLSATTRGGLQIVGMEVDACMVDAQNCIRAFHESKGINEEQRASVLAELWLQEALLREKRQTDQPVDIVVDAYLQSARQAYAYLFLMQRGPGQRALEDRQTQIRDYYNFAVQQAVTHLFKSRRSSARHPGREAGHTSDTLKVGAWKLHVKTELADKDRDQPPEDLIPASSLNFKGLRNQYRRDGVGAMLVAATAQRVVTNQSASVPYSETPFPAVTAIATFPGKNLADVLESHEALLTVYDPYQHVAVDLSGTTVPLAADFTAGYGLWLARSGFASQSVLSLIGKGDVLETPRVYLLQPYDPNRRTIIMLHGLASSPEAWINVANEVLGDEVLRKHFQIWQVYYPTNAPLAFNNQNIRNAIEQTLRHFDPTGQAPASRSMVLVGHSMGGVLSRLLVSSAEDDFLSKVLDDYVPYDSRRADAKQHLQSVFTFSPLPQVDRAIFIASPHRGTPFAQNRLSRLAASLVSLPVSVISQLSEITRLLADPGSTLPTTLASPINGISNLSHQDPFIIRAAELPIAPNVKYHSIIGNDTLTVPVEASSDGIVPYRSAHLDGAESELVIPGTHSVQDTPAAIVEIRRILHRHLRHVVEAR